MKNIPLLFLFLGITFLSFAQKNPEKQLGTWYMYNGTHKISNQVSLKTMAHFRFFDLGDDMQQFITRLGANYKINTNYSATLGYAYINADSTYGVDGGNANEHRIYTAINSKHKANALSIAQRILYEQRFFTGTTTQWIRYQMALNYPISKKWNAYLYDEIFVNFKGNAINQNWLGTGVSYKLSKVLKLKLGYQLIAINEGATFNRVLMGVTLFTNHLKNK